MEYLSEAELTKQIGYPRHLWPLAIVKELVDNAVDHCEEIGRLPDVVIKLTADSLTVADNGQGLPPETVAPLNPAVLELPPATVEAKALAVFPNPPPTVASWALAVFPWPPLTVDSKPLAVLSWPPLTVDSTPLAVLLRPPPILRLLS